MHVSSTLQTAMLFLIGRSCTQGLIKNSVTAAFSVMSNPLGQVPDVEIDPDGVFKYILIKVYAKQDTHGNEPSKVIVRGNKRGPYHADIYDEASAKIEKLGLDTECIGGGRITHDAANKNILVYGYSQGFGKADHEVTVDLLQKVYKDYDILPCE